MKPLVFVMNGRAIPEAMDSFRALDADLVWATGYNVAHLVQVHYDVVASTGYDVISVCSDDCIVSQDALDAVLALMDAGAPAATGWCRMFMGSPLANLTRGPLRGHYPRRNAYPLYEVEEVLACPTEAVPTGFMGMSLTTLTRDMWRRHPYGAYVARTPAGHSSDFNLCTRLRDAGIPMVAARSGYIQHLKRGPRHLGNTDPTSPLIVGQVEPSVTLDLAADRHRVPAGSATP